MNLVPKRYQKSPRKGAFLVVLVLRKQWIGLPFCRILGNVFDVLFKILSIADDVVVKMSLPNIAPVFFVAKPLER